jgi:ABC transporter substrate binding protein
MRVNPIARILTLVLSLGLVAPLAVEAQHADKVWRIGYLSPGSVGVFESFRLALRQLGYVEGQNLVIESRLAEREEQLPDLAAELVRLPVDVLVTRDTSSALAAKRATTTTPVVMLLGSDPVALGLVTSLARPGGNVTGVTALTAGLSAKRVELLKEAVSGVSRIGGPLESDESVRSRGVPRDAGRGQSLRGHSPLVGGRQAGRSRGAASAVSQLAL